MSLLGSLALTACMAVTFFQMCMVVTFCRDCPTFKHPEPRVCRRLSQVELLRRSFSEDSEAELRNINQRTTAHQLPFTFSSAQDGLWSPLFYDVHTCKEALGVCFGTQPANVRASGDTALEEEGKVCPPQDCAVTVATEPF